MLNMAGKLPFEVDGSSRFIDEVVTSRRSPGDATSKRAAKYKMVARKYGISI